MEHPYFSMDDLGGFNPLFSETSILIHIFQDGLKFSQAKSAFLFHVTTPRGLIAAKSMILFGNQSYLLEDGFLPLTDLNNGELFGKPPTGLKDDQPTSRGSYPLYKDFPLKVG